MGVGWPAGGEIDIIEGVNLMAQNQMALHTTTGCMQLTPQNQTGQSGNTNCSQAAAEGAGCTVVRGDFGELYGMVVNVDMLIFLFDDFFVSFLVVGVTAE